MIWPLTKKSNADAAIAVSDDAIQLACDKWLAFNEQFKFKDNVELQEQIMMFAVPMSEGLKNNFPELRNSPDAALLLFVAMGVEKSGTHTAQQIEEALGSPLPTAGRGL